MAPWIPLIGAGVSLIGKLFGSGKKQETTSRVDYKGLVKDAEAAGFNPLTALRAGGAQGFQVTSHPALSAQQAFGAGLQDVAGVLMNYDVQAERRAGLDFELQQAQLRNIEADTRMRMRSFEVPTRVGAQHVAADGRPVVTAPSGMAMPYEQAAGTVTHAGPWIDATVPDAETGEARYGEVMGEFFGVRAFGRDMRMKYDHVFDGTWAELPKLGPDPWKPVREAIRKPSTAVRVQPAPPRDSWLPDWVPSFGIEWE